MRGAAYTLKVWVEQYHSQPARLRIHARGAWPSCRRLICVASEPVASCGLSVPWRRRKQLEPKVPKSLRPARPFLPAVAACLLALGRLFADDHRDGSLEQLLLAPYPNTVLTLGKALAHWIINGIPLLVIAPVLGIQFNLPADALWMLVLSLAIGTPILSLLGSIGAALTLGLRGGGALVTLLILPLYVPALIFGAGAVEGALSGTGSEAHLSLLGAFLMVSLVLAPWVSAMALEISVE